MWKKLMALVSCGMVLLSACGQVPADSENSQLSVSSQVQAEEKSVEKLRTLVDGNFYADDEPGCVETQMLANDAGYILLYTDYAAGTQAPLCTKPGCPHNSAKCNAYLPGEWAGDRLLVAGDYVFAVDAHDSSMLNELDLQFFMVRYGLDGSGGELVFDIPGTFTMSDAVLCDGKALYFDIGNWSETDDVEYEGWQIGAWETYLIRVDIETGAIENVRDMKSRSLLGVADSQVLMWDTTTEPAGGFERELPRARDWHHFFHQCQFPRVQRPCRRIRP